MKITKHWLDANDASKDLKVEILVQEDRDSSKILEHLIKKDKLNWANWLVMRLMNHRQYYKWQVYAGQQVLKRLNKELSVDKEACALVVIAIRCVEHPTKENRRLLNESSSVYAKINSAYAELLSTSLGGMISAVRGSYSNFAGNAQFGIFVVSAIATSKGFYDTNDLKNEALHYGISVLEKTEV